MRAWQTQKADVGKCKASELYGKTRKKVLKARISVGYSQEWAERVSVESRHPSVWTIFWMLQLRAA
jgi:hypothetical protein